MKEPIYFNDIIYKYLLSKIFILTDFPIKYRIKINEITITKYERLRDEMEIKITVSSSIHQQGYLPVWNKDDLKELINNFTYVYFNKIFYIRIMDVKNNE